MAKFAETTEVPVEQAVANLARAGIPVADVQKTTLLDLSRERGLTPQQVYVKAVGQAQAAKVPLAEGGGYGRKTVQQICDQVQVPLEEGLGRLRGQGIAAAPADNVRDVAQRHGKTPIDVVRVIQG